jgi:predicted methyltransferase
MDASKRIIESMRLGATVMAAALVCATLSAFQDPSTAADFKAGDALREQYQNATGLLNALHLSPGDRVADIGAGAGYYTMRLSAIVGPEGRVFAEDVSDVSMRWLKARVEIFALPNVDVIQGSAGDPKLPERLDAALIVDSYHEFADPGAMLEHVFRALKPGGRIVIAEYSFAGRRVLSREDQVKQHEISPNLVRAELEHAGFRVIDVRDPFVARTALWLLIATRPPEMGHAKTPSRNEHRSSASSLRLCAFA